VIHGTEVSTTIDAVTGAAIFAVAEGVVEIRPNRGAPVSLGAGERLTVPPRGPAGPVERISPDRIADRLACLENALFHASAVKRTREALEVTLVDNVVGQDISDTATAPVAAALRLEHPPEPGPPELDPCTRDPGTCETAPDVNPFSAPPPPPPPPPGENPIPPCPPGGPPGEHCGF
jgi:hypothetical protein